MKAVSENRILNSMVSAIVHKSIEKTQKFNPRFSIRPDAVDKTIQPVRLH